jgi:hypothetical protein
MSLKAGGMAQVIKCPPSKYEAFKKEFENVPSNSCVLKVCLPADGLLRGD